MSLLTSLLSLLLTGTPGVVPPGAVCLGAATPFTISLGPAAVQDDELDGIFARYDQSGTPGCAVAVIEAGAVIFSEGYGQAHLEHPAPITPATPFHVASLSKQFTAFAVLLLAEEELLSLDDDVRRHLPEMHDFGAPITLRHLIHHTSGLRDQWDLLDFAGWRADDVITHEDVLRLVFRQRELNFPPGERYAYCNTGYTLLAEIVHRVSGDTLRDFCRQRIFEPLDMPSTQFYDDHTRLVPGRAESYSQGAGGYRRSVLSFSVVGATSLFTTVQDLARWTENLELRDLGGDEVHEQMLQCGTLNSGRELPYAGGLMLGQLRGLSTVSHTGADAGYRSALLWFPDYELSVAVLGNVDTLPAMELAEAVATVYLEDEMEIVQPSGLGSALEGLARRGANPDLDSPYVGPYCDPYHDEVYVIVDRDDVLNVEFGGRSYRTDPVGEDVFDVSLAAPLRRLRFTRDAEGAVVGLIAEYDDQEPLPFTRQPEAFSFNSSYFSGRFYSRELDVHYELHSRPGRLTLRRWHHDDQDLEIRYEDGFQLADQSDKLHFLRDAEGNLRGFLYSGQRARNLRFERVGDIED